MIIDEIVNIYIKIVVKEFIKHRLKSLLNESKNNDYQYQKRDIGGVDVYYKKMKNDKYWVFIDEKEFEKKSNDKNTVKFKENENTN